MSIHSIDLFRARVSSMEKDKYPHILLHRYTHGHRPRGNQGKWLDNIGEDCENLNLTVHQTYHLAKDRMTNTVRNIWAAGARWHRLRRKSFKSSQVYAYGSFFRNAWKGFKISWCQFCASWTKTL